MEGPLLSLFANFVLYILFFFFCLTCFVLFVAALFPSIPRHLIYLHKVKPDTWWKGGIEECSPIHSSATIRTKDGVNLGAWVVRGRGEGRSTKNKKKIVVIYFHGNADTRAQSRRKRLYPIVRSYFQKSIAKRYSNNPTFFDNCTLEVDLLAFDYRGFGDSGGSPSEGGVIEDGRAAYSFAISSLNADEVIFWGHSLGTGISTQTALSLLQDPPSSTPPPLKGLILEAPFRSLRWAALDHWVGLPIWFLPGVIVDKLFEFIPDKLDTEGGINKIVNSGVGVCILHGENDMIIGAQQGKHLYDIIKKKGGREERGYVMCHWFEGVGHNDCCFHEEMGGVVERFVEGVF